MPDCRISFLSISPKIGLPLFFWALFQFSFTPLLEAQDTLKVVQYNVLKYGSPAGGCTNPTSTKNIFLSTIMQTIQPDILGLNEMGDNTLHSDNILINVLRPINGDYEKADYTNASNSNLTNALFYNSKKLGISGQTVINHSLRDINVYTLYYKDTDLAATQDTIYIHLIIVHLKAGSSSNDQSIRKQQAQAIMNAMAGFNVPGNFLLMGDFNTKTSSEDSYQEFVNHTNLNIRFYDPIGTPGSWGSNASFAGIHTQSTRLTSEPDCGSTGGMDDRFDFILASDYVMNDSDGVHYVSGSYQAYGQDGQRYNQTISTPSNTTVSAGMANALYAVSDHLPIRVSLAIDGTITGMKKSLSDASGITLSIAGNPVGSIARIFLKNSSSSKQGGIILVHDLLGKVLIEQHLQLVPGSQVVDLNTSALAAGIYTLNFHIEGGEFVVKKLIKR